MIKSVAFKVDAVVLKQLQLISAKRLEEGSFAPKTLLLRKAWEYSLGNGKLKKNEDQYCVVHFVGTINKSSPNSPKTSQFSVEKVRLVSLSTYLYTRQ